MLVQRLLSVSGKLTTVEQEMTDKVTNIVLGLQRLMEETQVRGRDIRYAQQQEDVEHLKYLNELLGVVQRIHSAIIDDIREFSPRVEQAHVMLGNQVNPNVEPPKFLKQGPRKAAE